MRKGYNKKHTIDHVRNFIESTGHFLVSSEYINAITKLEIRCPEGHIFEVSWNNFSGNNGSRCPICWKEKNRGKNHWMTGLTGSKCFLYGKKRPEMRERMSGKNNPMYGLKGKDNPTFGNKYPELSEKLRGCKNPAWKGGISYEPYCELWGDKDFKQFILERDDYKCLNPECNKTSNRICIHHIDYNKKNCDPFNLITLCISCNAKANKDRCWHQCWYEAIIKNRYKRRINASF